MIAHRRISYRACLVLAPFLSLCGCSTTRTITSPSPSGEYRYEDFHNEVGSSRATVILSDGRSFEGSGFRIERDSVFWAGSDTSYSASVHEVRRITGRNHYRGGVEWFWLGLLTGMGVGVASGDAFVALGSIVLGPAVGMLGGTIAGHGFTYDFDIRE